MGLLSAAEKIERNFIQCEQVTVDKAQINVSPYLLETVSQFPYFVTLRDAICWLVVVNDDDAPHSIQ